jgi:hypothetical protein
MIDARIDKALARLVCLKEFKRVARPLAVRHSFLRMSPTGSGNQREVENGATTIEGVFMK